MEITVNVNGIDFTLNTDTLPEAALRYVIEYGLKQTLADAGASKPDADAKREAAAARHAKLLAGDVPAGGGTRGDPMAAAVVTLLKTGKVRKLAAVKYTPEDVAQGLVGAANFDDATWARINAAAAKLVEAKRLEV